MYNESFEFFLTFRIFWISIVLSQSVRGSIHETITAIAGMESGLPCNLTSPTPDDDIALVLWYKDESTTPIYSLDSRRSPVKVAKHVASDEYASRAYLETLQSPSLLKLAPVLKEDEGDYKCRADFKNARTRYSSVTLRVIVPPKTPVISDESGEILQSLIGPYNEGDRLKLICETTGGDPSPSLTWWRESVLLDESYRHSPQQGITRNELDIRVLQRHDLMAVFSCRAKNNVITAPITSTVTVDLNFRPLDVKLDYDGHPLSAMKPIELICRTTGSRPPATVTWYKGKSKLKSAKDAISADGNTTTSVLHYVPSSDDNAEKLICKAENLLIPGSQIEDAVALDIYYIPKVSLRLGNKLRHKHIQEGNDVYFECSVQANPFIGYVEWLFEGQELVTNTTAGIILSNQSLVLQNVLRDKRGRYVCKGRNSEGEGTSNTVTLRVQYSPLCKSEQRIRYGAALGETITVSCEVEADPTAVKFYWLFNRTTPPLDSISFASEGTKSVASYHVANEENYGSLYCWASNNVATQSQPCQFVIFQAGPPDPVFNCSVTNQTNTCFTVECLHNTVNEAAISIYYLMELYDSHWKRLFFNESSSTPSFRACKLPPGTRFIIVLFAVNAKGRSESVTIHTGTQAPYESFAQTNEQWKVIFSPTLLVLMSVIAVLVTIAVTFVVMIKVKENYIRKKAAKAHTEDKKMEKLLQKDQGGICKSVSIGLDEKCPDIISGPVYASV